MRIFLSNLYKNKGFGFKCSIFIKSEEFSVYVQILRCSICALKNADINKSNIVVDNYHHSGKSAAVYACAQEQGFEVLESFALPVSITEGHHLGCRCCRLSPFAAGRLEDPPHAATRRSHGSNLPVVNTTCRLPDLRSLPLAHRSINHDMVLHVAKVRATAEELKESSIQKDGMDVFETSPNETGSIPEYAGVQALDEILLNASDSRNGAFIKKKFGEALESHGVKSKIK
ncbi:hypothetical protein CR513_33516, partial [Mucuna pruriens]